MARIGMATPKISGAVEPKSPLKQNHFHSVCIPDFSLFLLTLHSWLFPLSTYSAFLTVPCFYIFCIPDCSLFLLILHSWLFLVSTYSAFLTVPCFDIFCIPNCSLSDCSLFLLFCIPDCSLFLILHSWLFAVWLFLVSAYSTLLTVPCCCFSALLTASCLTVSCLYLFCISSYSTFHLIPYMYEIQISSYIPHFCLFNLFHMCIHSTCLLTSLVCLFHISSYSFLAVLDTIKEWTGLEFTKSQRAVKNMEK